MHACAGRPDSQIPDWCVLCSPPASAQDSSPCLQAHTKCQLLPTYSCLCSELTLQQACALSCLIFVCIPHATGHSCRFEPSNHCRPSQSLLPVPAHTYSRWRYACFAHAGLLHCTRQRQAASSIRLTFILTSTPTFTHTGSHDPQPCMFCPCRAAVRAGHRPPSRAAPSALHQHGLPPPGLQGGWGCSGPFLGLVLSRSPPAAGKSSVLSAQEAQD